VLIADVDGLKKVNDSLGHQAGDGLIRRAAEVIKAALSEGSVAARIGGDEFAVLAPHTTYHEAEALARRIEQSVNEEFQDLGVSISVGIAGYPRDTLDPTDLRAIADRRLYEIKDARRR